jgi:hypothetical protein
MNRSKEIWFLPAGGLGAYADVITGRVPSERKRDPPVIGL